MVKKVERAQPLGCRIWTIREEREKAELELARLRHQRTGHPFFKMEIKYRQLLVRITGRFAEISRREEW